MTQWAIETRDLTKIYGNRVAVDGLTMSIRRGEVFGFLGPNGAGKTTAVKMLLGLVLPTSGAAAILGKPLGDIQARRKVGYLPELFRYQEWLSAREVLQWHAALLKIPSAVRAREIDDVLERVGLAARARDRVGTFSKGMQQRLGLGVSLLGSPDLIFLDEPTSALDPVGRADVRDLISGLKSRGTTVFLNSHLLTEVEYVCDRVAIVDGGRTIAQGNLNDLLGRFGLRVVFETITPAVRAALESHEAAIDGAAAVIYGVDDATTPDVVAKLVGAGARIVRVESVRLTLEERFLELLKAKA